MRLLFVHEVSYRDKVVYEMHDIPELLSLAGHDVTFIDFGEGGERKGVRRWFDWRTRTSIVRQRAHVGAEVLVITPGRLFPPPLDRLVASLSQVPVLVRTLRQRPFDAVVLYAVPTNGWQALMVAHRFGVPVLFRALDISHRLRPTIFASLIKRAERFIYRRADAVSANNHALARYIIENGANPDTVSVDYPGLDLERFSPGAKPQALLERYGLDETSEVVQYMGTLYRFAGLDWLLERLVPVLERRPSTRIMFVGGGEAEPELRSVVDDLGMGDQVIFTGWIDYEELADHLRLADVAVTPFAEELVANCALPSKVVQYAGCGIPTVCTRLDGMQAMIPEGRGVTYAAPGEQFVERIESWLENPMDRVEAGRRARHTIEELCEWDHAVERFLRAIEATRA